MPTDFVDVLLSGAAWTATASAKRGAKRKRKPDIHRGSVYGSP